MRIASVLHDASLDKDGAPLLPVLAIERDGALYRVDELARALGSRCPVVLDHDDLSAAIALRGEAIREIDERVRSGERPSSARLLPGAFTWLAPCDTERAALFVCASEIDRDDRGPSFRMASARALLGHEATVPVLAESPEIGVTCAVASVLGDDLHRASAREASEAIFGSTLMLSFDHAAGAQLGPSLVTRDEHGSIASLRAQIRVDGRPLPVCEVGDRPFAAAETIAWISHHVPLRAGDVIGASPIRSGSIDDPILRVPFGSRVELAVERLGRLAGKPARGPEMSAWRLPRR